MIFFFFFYDVKDCFLLSNEFTLVCMSFQNIMKYQASLFSHLTRKNIILLEDFQWVIQGETIPLSKN